jgi:hypothetical protein
LPAAVGKSRDFHRRDASSDRWGFGAILADLGTRIGPVPDPHRPQFDSASSTDEWRKPISRRTAKAPWLDDLPLDERLPGELVIDCAAVLMPIHPMFLVRLRVFIDWHKIHGRSVALEPPTDPATRCLGA